MNQSLYSPQYTTRLCKESVLALYNESAACITCIAICVTSLLHFWRAIKKKEFAGDMLNNLLLVSLFEIRGFLLIEMAEVIMPIKIFGSQPSDDILSNTS